LPKSPRSPGVHHRRCFVVSKWLRSPIGLGAEYGTRLARASGVDLPPANSFSRRTPSENGKRTIALVAVLQVAALVAWIKYDMLRVAAGNSCPA
jgi:hypothetical protein